MMRAGFLSPSPRPDFRRRPDRSGPGGRGCCRAAGGGRPTWQWLGALLAVVGITALEVSAADYGQPAAGTEPRWEWPSGKRAAVSLTFDDARFSQMDVGLALFERHGARATFYVSPDRLDARLDRWREAVRQGHEIGHHSLSHPCTGNFEFARGNALEDYTLEQMGADLAEATVAIERRLGVRPVSFAYPCGQTFVGRGVNTRSYVPLVARLFASGRLWRCEDTNDPLRYDPAQVMALELDGKTFLEVRPLLERARERGRWLVFAGHEIGTSGHQTTRVDTLEAILAFTGDPANGLWLDTVGAVNRQVQERRALPAGPSTR
jgi:peptidoglycan-N-acetylglucosamine deacetylase